MNISKKELVRFLIGGGTAVIIDYTLYHVFIRIGFILFLSKALSFFCGATVGFIINKFWTFESSNFSKKEILRYIILYSITACINGLVNKIVLYGTDVSLIAFLCATGISTILNFLGQKYFVFKEGR